MSTSKDPTPCEDALDRLWKDIILARIPTYGDWEYPGQAYRHILAEHNDTRALAEKLAEENRILKKRITELEEEKQRTGKIRPHIRKVLDRLAEETRIDRAEADRIDARNQP